MNITETIECQCGTTFEWLSEESGEKWRPIYMPRRCKPCEAIVEAKIEERQAQEAAERLASAQESIGKRLLQMTPPRYQRTDINHPAFNRNIWKRASSWKPTDDVPFLGLIGVSGTCKTRIGFMRLRDIVSGLINSREAADGRVFIPTFYAMTSPDFAQLVGKQFMSNSGPRGSWDNDPKQDARQHLDRLRDCDVLFLDDMGKAKNTPSVAAELFAVIDHRHAYNLTTIWSANSTPEEIVSGMSEDMAGPLAGRLIECSEIITFK